MKSEWKVSSQYIGGEKMYIAMRILDTSQPQHGGNVETRGEYSTDQNAVQALVDMLNAETEIWGRALSIHEELVNEKWLEKRIQEIAGGSVDVEKKRDMLWVDILINRGSLADVQSKSEAVAIFLNKWLPAHLAYNIIYEKLLSAVDYYAGIWQDDEIILLRQVRI